ncbi:hypothetical protein CYMTET_17176 [Cymbomonas tetramitiformis]|uniref:Uncharacterized protein n=1 Tax=Cymbomonas tetramitiformis TaxID=36881 RepID=A0AAE0GAV8_9CHLO|nr:hypothetical protein CYMTET_17176 [Cymbomonas tetramitiformis]
MWTPFGALLQALPEMEAAVSAGRRRPPTIDIACAEGGSHMEDIEQQLLEMEDHTRDPGYVITAPGDHLQRALEEVDRAARGSAVIAAQAATEAGSTLDRVGWCTAGAEQPVERLLCPELACEPSSVQSELPPEPHSSPGEARGELEDGPRDRPRLLPSLSRASSLTSSWQSTCQADITAALPKFESALSEVSHLFSMNDLKEEPGCEMPLSADSGTPMCRLPQVRSLARDAMDASGTARYGMYAAPERRKGRSRSARVCPPLGWPPNVSKHGQTDPVLGPAPRPKPPRK